jgi:hypothetical protein
MKVFMYQSVYYALGRRRKGAATGLHASGPLRSRCPNAFHAFPFWHGNNKFY